MPNILAEIELNEKQVKAFNEELNAWKEKTRAQLEEEVRSDVQTEYKVKLRKLKEESENFKQEQKELVEEMKGKMQKVMVKRFTEAVKQMYDQLKVEARKEVLSDPRLAALEEVKNIVYPLMDETVTKGYVDELAKALQVVESKELENDKLRAKLKLREIVSTLSPTVAEAVETFIGEATSEEEVVEKYARLKNLVSEAKKKKSKEDCPPEDEDEDDEDFEDDFEELDEEGDGDAIDRWEQEEEDFKKKKKDKKKRKDEARKSSEDDFEDEEEDEDDFEDEDEDELDEDLEIKPTVKYNKKEGKKKSNDYVDTLNEMLNLAGVPLD